MTTYCIYAPKLKKGGYKSIVKTLSNSKGDEFIYARGWSASEEAAVIKAARWLIDYLELELMSKDEEEPRY